MTRNNMMAKRLGVAALSALLVWSMPGTPAFAEGMAEVATGQLSALEQQDNAAEDTLEGAVDAADAAAAEDAAEGGAVADAAAGEDAADQAAPQAADARAAADGADDGAAADVSAQSADARVARAGETVTVSAASELPETVEAGATVVLAANITLDEGQQIAQMAGTLDGQGHSIALNGKALIKSLTGTVQNLGVTGWATMGESEGALAVNCSGNVRMCWSAASLDDGGSWSEYAGLVGSLSGGAITNSYVAGTMSGIDLLISGIVKYYASGTVANNLFTGGGQVCANKNDPAFGTKVTIAELGTQASVDKLNTDAPTTGFSWAAQGGLPVLVAGSATVTVNKDALASAIAAAEAKVEGDYTAESWSALAGALAAAKDVYANDDATQAEVNEAAKALGDAIDALEKPKPTEPVAQPQENVVHLSSQDDLDVFGGNKFKPAATGAYYVLDNDIAIDDEWFFAPTGMLAGTLDGQGHTITFANGGGVKSLMDGVASTGIVQNISFAGELKQATDNRAFGPLGNSVQGAVLNCVSAVSGKGVAGLARTLDGGVVSNCVSTATGTAGALFASYASGQLINTYWGAYLTNKMNAPASALVNSYAVEPADMATDSFRELLNANNGANGNAWGIDAAGNPVFGTGNRYEPSDEPLPDNAYTVTFADNDGKVSTVADHVLEVSPDTVAADRKIGTLALEGVAAGSTITWGTDDANRNNIAVDESTGELYVYGNATGTVTATEHKADGTAVNVATVTIKAKARAFDDFELWYRGADGVARNVTDGNVVVQGSEVRNLEVRVHYVGADEGEYVPVSYSRFHFAASDPTVIYSNDYSACFYFKKAASATITVTPRDTASAGAGSKSVTVTSAPVAATAISMGYNEDGATVYLHGRNPLSERGAFLTDHARPVVTPDNATNRDNFAVTSSNPEVAAYTTSGEIGYTPYKAGTTTFTATLPDTDAEGSPLSASVDVTYAYQNPLKSVTAAQDELSLKAGTSDNLALNFEGENDAEGWSVSEPGLTWTYKTLDGKDAKGIVSIDRAVAGAWKHEDGAPDDGEFVASSDYVVTALSAGTVVATGTPVDTTAGAEPVTVTITVTGVAPSPATGSSAAAGIESASAYIDSQRPADAFTYGFEWEIYDYLKAGRTIDSKLLDNYRASLKAHKAEWGSATSPVTETERVALALAAVGEDITDFDGVNLAELIYGRADLSLANEKIFALLALDAGGVAVPGNATWTRAMLVDALCEMLANGDASAGVPGGDVDITAMAIQALAPYIGDAKVSAAVEQGLASLRASMNTGTCDFGSAEADAQVILALLALDRDPADEVHGFANAATNVVCALDQYRVAGANGYAHVAGGKVNAMATEQALRALAAYRMASGEGIVWKTAVTAGKAVDNGGAGNGGSQGGQGNGGAGNGGQSQGNGGSQGGSGQGAGQNGRTPQQTGSGSNGSNNGTAAGNGANGTAAATKADASTSKDAESAEAATAASDSSATKASKKAKSAKAANGAKAVTTALDEQDGVNPAVVGIAIGATGFVAVGAWFVVDKRRRNAA